MVPMTQRDADYYQAHKDDSEEWGEPQPTPKSQRRRLVAMISVRFSPEEERAVRRAAQQMGRSVSNFIRQAALKAAGYREHTAEVPRSPTETTSTTSFARTAETTTGNTRVDVLVEAGTG
jgi:mobilization protein NikA